MTARATSLHGSPSDHTEPRREREGDATGRREHGVEVLEQCLALHPVERRSHDARLDRDSGDDPANSAVAAEHPHHRFLVHACRTEGADALRQHVAIGVDRDDRHTRRGQRHGELAGAATEVERTRAAAEVQHRDEVLDEGTGILRAEARVVIGRAGEQRDGSDRRGHA